MNPAQVGYCTPSARCHPEYSQTRAAVIDIYAINLSLGAMALCTGVSLLRVHVGAAHLLPSLCAFSFSFGLPCRKPSKESAAPGYKDGSCTLHIACAAI